MILFPESISAFFCADSIYFCCATNYPACNMSVWPRQGQLVKYQQLKGGTVVLCMTAHASKVGGE